MAENDELDRLLMSGWKVAGYSTSMLAAGAMTHCVLLQSDDGALATATILLNGQKEVGRHVVQLSPLPAAPPKKGFWG